jgi:hypothetical protein
MLSFIHFTQFSCIRIFQGHSRAWATPWHVPETAVTRRHE